MSGNTTWGRTGEYAPLGRNIADIGPYITLTTVEPIEGGSGVTMFPSGAGYQPGQREFSIDGLVVPESAFMQIINSGYIGGAFGLMEIANRMSVRDYSVRFNDGNMQLERFFGSEGAARDYAVRMNQTTVFKNILVSNAWSVLAAIAPLARQQDNKHQSSSKGNDEKNRWAIVEQTVSNVLSRLENNSECLKTINHDGYDLSPAVALKRIFDRGSFPYNKNIDVTAQTSPNQTDSGVIELGPSFFKKTIKDERGNDWNKVTGLNTLRTREFIILHELRHLYGSAHGDDIELLKEDFTKILKDCFGVTPDFSGGIK